MTNSNRWHIALSSALPTLAAALAILPVMSAVGLVPWLTAPAVVLAVAVQTLFVFIRLRPVFMAHDPQDRR